MRNGSLRLYDPDDEASLQSRSQSRQLVLDGFYLWHAMQTFA